MTITPPTVDHFSHILAGGKGLPRITVAVIHPVDAHALEAAADAQAEGLITLHSIVYASKSETNDNGRSDPNTQPQICRPTPNRRCGGFSGPGESVRDQWPGDPCR